MALVKSNYDKGFYNAIIDGSSGTANKTKKTGPAPFESIVY